MEEQNQELNEHRAQRSKMWMLIVIVVLVLGVIGLIIWMMMARTELDELRSEKDYQRWQLELQLDSIVIEHGKVKEAYGEISDSLAGMDSTFQAQADEIKSLLNYKWEFYKVKKKLDRLQVVAQGYIRRMDSIVVVNDELTMENLEMREEIKIANRNFKSLEKEKDVLEEKVDEASKLGAYNLRAQPVHVKGSGKEVTTDKVKRAKRINVCFTLSENTIIPPGKRTIYFRIAQPDKEILIAGRGEKYTFEHQGEVLQFSIKKDINYQNEAMDICVKYNLRSTQEIQAGTYHVDIFDGDFNIGHTTFDLK